MRRRLFGGSVPVARACSLGSFRTIHCSSVFASHLAQDQEHGGGTQTLTGPRNANGPFEHKLSASLQFRSPGLARRFLNSPL